MALSYEELLKKIEFLKKENIELHYSNTITSSTINSQKFSLFAVDRQLKYTYFNKAHADNMLNLNDINIQIGDYYPNFHKNKICNNEILSLLNDALSGKTISYTTYFIDKNEATIYFDFTFAPIKINDHAVIGVSISAIESTTNHNTKTELEKHKNKLEEIIENRNNKLKASEEKFRTLSESSAAGIFIHNGAIFEYFNEAMLKATGFSANDMETMAFMDLVYDEDKPMATDYWNRRNEGKQVPSSYECRINKRDGGYVWADVSAKLLKINGKNALIGTAFEITERKHAEEQLINAKEKAEESDRLKTAFLQNISHEIRTPLNAIMGFSQLLNSNKNNPDKIDKFTNIIIKSSNDLLNVVTDILTISSLEAGAENIYSEEVNINHFLNEIFLEYKQKSENQNLILYLKKQLPDNLSTIVTDYSKLYKIFTNLLDNALKFTFTGYIEFGYYIKENEFIYYVKDTGIGIKKEFHKTIFERFRQADILPSNKKAISGLGLGLNISKAFVQLLKGEMWLESEFGSGSTFCFSIPFNSINIKNNINKDNEIIIPNNLHPVLIVEDEEHNFLYLSELLYNNQGVDVIHARNGKEAIQMCSKNPNFRFVIMDIKIPIIDGYEATRIIKSQFPELPIIACTAFASNDDKNKALDSGFDDYFVKPINNTNIKTLMDKYLTKLN